jgi:hypothetical protein
MRRAAAVLAIMLAASTAHAEPSPADKETARELFNQGKDAQKAGDKAAALEKFKAAHDLAATPITALELAKAQAALNHLVAARDVALSVARLPSGASESDRAKEARAAAAKLAESIYPRIATLTIVVNRAATVTLDGETLTAREGYRVDPGPHKLTGQIGNGPLATSDLELAEGERRTTTLDVTAPADTPPAPPPPPPALVPPPPRRAPSPLLWIGLGGAVVGTGVGTVTGILALSKASTSACQDTRCTATGRSDISDGRTFATVSTIAFSVAVAGAIVAAYAFFVKPDRAASLQSPVQ